MPIVRLPSTHDTSYPPARGPVLLLSCMDLRFMDEIVQFMDHDGLTNRYDHITIAGAALGAMGAHTPEYQHWKQTFFEHLHVAHKLHYIKDVYILEHRDCGAYREFLGEEGDFDETEEAEEYACHRKYAESLRKEIESWSKQHKIKLFVKCFLMDLRGHVSLMSQSKSRRH
ncbi:MAG: carbonic anhydrase [Pirellulales bacterium]